MKKSVIITAILFVSISSRLFSQSDSVKIFRVTLLDDSEYIGTILSDTDSLLVIKTFGGAEIKILPKSISEKEMFNGFWINGRLVRRDPNSTRLLFAPTGRTLKQGKGYFSDYELFLPFLSVGLTDNITLSGGVSLIPGADEQMVYLAPKIGIIQEENQSISGGLLYMHLEEDSFGILYGVGSFGNSQQSFTIGFGFGFSNGEFAKSPFVVLGGEVQFSNSFKLLTENWLNPNFDGAIVSLAMRFFGDSLAADFGFITTTKSKGSFPFIPWLGFSYNF